jgi:hypothetical protein
VVPAAEHAGVASFVVDDLIPSFRCGWFHLVGSDHVDAVRLLADAQDIAAVFADSEWE